jgi:hypothetical protein
MANKQHVCDSCLRLCDEAKQAVVVLQKRNYILTIVCTVAITLLGEQGAKMLMSAIDTTTSAIKAADTDIKEDSSIQSKKEHENIVSTEKYVWTMPDTNLFAKHNNKKIIKPYESVDELSKFPNIEEASEKSLSEETIREIVNGALENSPMEEPVLEIIPKVTFNNTDNNAVFFTPSLLPFDVYSTTLALGNNYGFGEYYGINSGLEFVVVPGPASLGGLGIFVLLKNRRRN